MSADLTTAHLRRFAISGASCAGCVRKIENALAQTEGVMSASLNFADRSLCVAADIPSDDIINAIEKLGYGALETTTSSLQDIEQQNIIEANKESHALQRRALIALLPGIAMMLWGMIIGDMMVNSSHSQIGWGVAGIVSAFAMLFAGRSIYITGWRSALHGSPSMDSLVALGTLSAWLYSLVIVISYDVLPPQARHVYFEASTMILGFVNLGRWLEHRARQKTGAAIHNLLKRQAKEAWLINDKQETLCPVDAISVSKRIRVKPGETIPLDGEIDFGVGVIDESMLSGEPIPIEKSIGDKVFAGCINGGSTFSMLVTARSNDSTLAGIIRSVQQAQGAKPPIGQLADRISAIFVPAIIVIALLSASLWWWFGPVPQATYAMITGVSVLIIACPCALGLATPMSVMVGVGRAAELGILIRNGDALQGAQHIDTLVIDKTGTLTLGKPEVCHVDLEQTIDKHRLFTLTRALESHSEHALASALEAYCQAHGGASNADVESITIQRGLGISGVVNQDRVAIGSERFMASSGIAIPPNTEDNGYSVVYVAINDRYAARFFFTDPLREDSHTAIQRIQNLGINCVIVSGDSETSVARVAKELGISQYHARSLPEDKQSYVASLQSLGKNVAMAGDGINDAPALAIADVSFAMGSGTDIAVSSADIALMRNSISGVADAIAVSHATLRNIKQNLFWAFAYNLIGIPIAAGALYPFTGELLNPMIAGAAMALSSVTVASNANRLRWTPLKI